MFVLRGNSHRSGLENGAVSAHMDMLAINVHLRQPSIGALFPANTTHARGVSAVHPPIA